MFSSQYCFAWQDCEAQSSLSFPPVASPAFIGTIRPSDCLLLLCTPSLIVMHTTTDTLRSGSRRLSQLTQHHCTTWLTSNPVMPNIPSP